MTVNYFEDNGERWSTLSNDAEIAQAEIEDGDRRGLYTYWVMSKKDDKVGTYFNTKLYLYKNIIRVHEFKTEYDIVKKDNGGFILDYKHGSDFGPDMFSGDSLTDVARTHFESFDHDEILNEIYDDVVDL